MSGKVFAMRHVGWALPTKTRDLFELRHAHYLINSWNLQDISLSPLGGEGRVRGGMERQMKPPLTRCRPLAGERGFSCIDIIC